MKCFDGKLLLLGELDPRRLVSCLDFDNEDIVRGVVLGHDREVRVAVFDANAISCLPVRCPRAILPDATDAPGPEPKFYSRAHSGQTLG